jgi:predicted transposase YdaD
VSSSTWLVYSPFAREHFGRGKAEGLAEGRAEGWAEGFAEGWAEGFAEGRAKGWAKAVLRVLAARRIEVPEEARVRISACADLRQLDVWLDRAVVATSVAELFD